MKEVAGSVNLINVQAYYIAPEVLREKYDEKCDIWSCGVIMYMLLCGEPPFFGNTNDDIIKNVEKGIISYDAPQWKKVSKQSINLLKKMLTYDHKKRITAEEALGDSWFSLFSNKCSKDSMKILECIKNLRSFQVTSVMQKAVLSYMAAHIISKDEEKKLREIFTELDQKHNGFLSIEELAEGYLLLFKGDLKVAKEEAKRTMKRLDINNNGTIDYNGIINFNNRISYGKFTEKGFNK